MKETVAVVSSALGVVSAGMRVVAKQQKVNKWPKNFDEGPHRKGICPSANTCVLGPTLVHTPNCISIGLIVFAKFTVMSNGLFVRVCCLCVVCRGL